VERDGRPGIGMVEGKRVSHGLLAKIVGDSEPPDKTKRPTAAMR
jgi:hypothetical protein